MALHEAEALRKKASFTASAVSPWMAQETTKALVPKKQAMTAGSVFATDFGDDKKATVTKTGDTRIPGRPQIPYPIAEAVAERQKTANENLSANRFWQSFWRIIGMRRACRRPP